MSELAPPTRPAPRLQPATNKHGNNGQRPNNGATDHVERHLVLRAIRALGLSPLPTFSSAPLPTRTHKQHVGVVSTS